MTEQQLTHFGIKGMKWGVRRYQNEDGTLTSAGKKREEKISIKDYAKNIGNIAKKAGVISVTKKGKEKTASAEKEINTQISKIAKEKSKEYAERVINEAWGNQMMKDVLIYGAATSKSLAIAKAYDKLQIKNI